MNLESILAVTDFSTVAEHALERAALIAARHQAKLRIIYGAEVPNLGLSDPLARLQQRGRQLARRHTITVEVLGHTSHMLDDVVKHARSANLLVLDHRRQRVLPAFWRGTTLDQLLRRCPCPVLIVKQVPGGRYARLLVAVDFAVESEKLVRYASSLDAELELELLHSYEALHKAGQGCMRSDLVIVGKNRNSTLVDFLFGNLVKRLIHWVRSDILVFPHDYQIPSGAMAKERIQTLLSRSVSI